MRLTAEIVIGLLIALLCAGVANSKSLRGESRRPLDRCVNIPGMQKQVPAGYFVVYDRSGKSVCFPL